jgi:hypothetical protein
MKFFVFPETIASSLRAASAGLVFAFLTILFGQGMGVAFGVNEDAIKSRLKESAAAVRDSRYRADDAAMRAVLEKSWAYMQRAHLHAGGMGTTALVVIVFGCLLGATPGVTFAISLALGGGGFGYSVYWMWAGFRAPGLGSTGAAKESLTWLALPSSAAFVVGTLAVFVLLIGVIARRRPTLADQPRGR